MRQRQEHPADGIERLTAEWDGIGAASGLTIRPAVSADVPAIRAFMLRIFEEDFGYGYQPHWHGDYDDLQGIYLDNPRHTLILALDDPGGEIVGTGGLRSGGPTRPAWLVERYQPPERTARITRLFIHGHRRRGIGRVLVEQLRRFVDDVGGYDRISLQTETATDFWESFGGRVVHDGRTADPPEEAVHFELPVSTPHSTLNEAPKGNLMQMRSTSPRVVAPLIETGRGFSVREVIPADFAEAREVIVRVLDEDLKYGYLPQRHWDIDDMQGTYLDNRRHALFVAVDHGGGQIIGTIAVRTDGPTSPPHPRWLAERYAPDTACQLFRAYITREHRRRGVARALVEAARRFIRDERGYDTIYLHTNPSVPGAEPFWRAMPTTEVFDARREEGAPGSNALHFELEMLPAEVPASASRRKT